MKKKQLKLLLWNFENRRQYWDYGMKFTGAAPCNAAGEFHCTDISQTKQAAMEQKISKKATPLEINGVRFLQDGYCPTESGSELKLIH